MKGIYIFCAFWYSEHENGEQKEKNKMKMKNKWRENSILNLKYRINMINIKLENKWKIQRKRFYLFFFVSVWGFIKVILDEEYRNVIC